MFIFEIDKIDKLNNTYLQLVKAQWVSQSPKTSERGQGPSQLIAEFCKSVC